MNEMVSNTEKLLHVMTFGCQMNEHDSERIAGVMGLEGYTCTGDVEKADLIIVNTCSVRDKAEHKFYSELGRLRKYKKAKPDLLIGVAGCIAQQEGEKIIRRAPYVDLVFGTSNILNLPAMVKRRVEHHVRVTEVDFDREYNMLDLPADRGDGLKAWVSIMYGCDNFCSYCVVPFTRGREMSRPSASIHEEISRLAADGYKEVTLLGQNVNSYGKGLEEGVDFPALLRLIHDIDGIERIRFVTSHPKDLSDRLIEAMAELPKLCEGLHLPMQSGSDGVLSRMRRGYTFAEYYDKVKRMRQAVPDLYLTSDIIVGFPGETDEDFRATVRALEMAEFDSIFLFQYSPRPDTQAGTLPEQLADDVKAERFNIVMDLQQKMTLKKNSFRVGMVQEIMVEGASKKGSELMNGRNRGGAIVNFEGECRRGELVNVLITEGLGYCLKGKIT